MSEKTKKHVNNILNHEKIKVLLIPVTGVTILYGFQLLLAPDILLVYDLYYLVQNVINPNSIGLLCMLLSLGMITGFATKNRGLLLGSAIVTVMFWTMLTVGLFVSPPPNTDYILSGLMVYLTFSLARRV